MDTRNEQIEAGLQGAAYGIAVGYDRVWLVGEQLLRRVDPSDLLVDVEIALPSTGVGVDVAAGEHAVWTVTTPVIHFGVQGTQRVGRGVLTRVDPETTAVATTIQVGGLPEAVAAGLGSVWVTDIERHALIRVDPRTDSVAELIPLGARPTDVTIAAGLVWVSVV